MKACFVLQVFRMCKSADSQSSLILSAHDLGRLTAVTNGSECSKKFSVIHAAKMKMELWGKAFLAGCQSASLRRVSQYVKERLQHKAVSIKGHLVLCVVKGVLSVGVSACHAIFVYSCVFRDRRVLQHGKCTGMLDAAATFTHFCSAACMLFGL